MPKAIALLIERGKQSLPSEPTPTSDRELLERFLEQRDPAAFGALVDRHASLLLGQCRRWTDNLQDAEDVVQAAFLALAKSGGSIRRRDSVAGWLYRVARRMANQTRLAAAAQKRRDTQAARRRLQDSEQDSGWQGMLRTLDEELFKLAERHRAALQLCYLEGRTQDEAARELGWSSSTLRRRLNEGRELLCKRMADRGAVLSSGYFAGFLALSAERCPLTSATRKFLAQVGSGAAAGRIPVAVAILAQGGLSIMPLAKVLVTTIVVTALCGLAVPGIRQISQATNLEEPLVPASSQIVSNQENGNRVDLFGEPLPQEAIARIGTTTWRDRPTILTFSGDKRLFAYGLEQGSVKVCDAASGKLVLEIPGDKAHRLAASELAFSSDSRLLAVGGCFWQAIHIYDMNAKKLLYTIENRGAGEHRVGTRWQRAGFAFSPDIRTLIVGGKDGSIHIVDTNTGKESACLSMGLDRIRSISLTSDGKTAFTVHADDQIHLWDIENRKHLSQFGQIETWPQFTALAPDGKTVAICVLATQIEIWDISPKKMYTIETDGPIAGLGFSVDGSTIQILDGKGTLSALKLSTGANVWSRNRPEFHWRHSEDGNGPQAHAWFSSDGKTVAVETEGSIRILDTVTGAEQPRPPLRGGVQWVAFGPDGKSLRVVAADGEIGNWDPATGRQQGPTRKSELDWDAHLRMDSARKVVAAVTSGHSSAGRRRAGGRNIYLPDSIDDAVPKRLTTQVAPANDIALTPDGKYLIALENEGVLQIYDTTTKRPVRTIAGGKNCTHPTISPDGKYLACAAYQESDSRPSIQVIHLFDLASGQLLNEWRIPGATVFLAFSPTSQTLATSHLTSFSSRVGDGEPFDPVYFWEIPSGKRKLSIRTGDDPSLDLAFSPDGSLLATGKHGSTVKLWETATGLERHQFAGHSERVFSMDFAPDGQRLATGSLDGTALIWRLFGPASDTRSESELEKLWVDLGRDAMTCHQAIGALIAAKETVAYLNHRLKAAAQEDPEDLQTAPDRLREIRAAEALGHIGDGEACKLLSVLAKGVPEAALTRQAKASLAAIEQRRK